MTVQPGNPTEIDLLIHARWVIPVSSEQSVLDAHCVAVDSGLIVEILPSDTARQFYLPKNEVVLANHVLIPGLVNAHGHAAMTLLRGAADDMPLHTWLHDYIWPLEGRWVSEEFVHQGTQLAIAEMLLSGTTCFADMYFFPDAAARAAKDAGIRAQLAAPVLDFPTIWATDADDYIVKATQLHDSYRNHSLISVAFGPHAPYTVSDAPLRKIATLAEEMDVPIHMHIHETAQEVSDAVTATGKRPLQRLVDLGLVSPRLLCVHATQLTDTEIALLAETGASVVHCPESNLKLASGFCPTGKLAKAGVNIALGTDGAASNNDLDMFSEMRTAALLAKAVAGDASAIPALQALQIATINGAKALGMDDKIGSLEAGKYADIVAVDMQTINAIPLYSPLSHLTYSTNSSQVSHVWVAGKLLVDNRQLTTLDLDLLRTQTAAWQTRIQSGTEN
ncbi:MAG: TRZ/ATZ family hydrolase [Gammaproteobacteria bacterium]|nr:TRZ/ATZ family hydrolase [Gammaproteobacteria bacterium]MDP2140891.1 TRZ/ATZ family hydrolase [Gammaproteobacteria bacterium]MDP2349365.1 TRZ/ATZ family hydrolase [Gammaproteobacteria bacterium]